MVDWPTRISTLAFVKSKLAECDIQHTWPYRLPRVAATESEIRQVEQHLGFAIPADFFSFLLHANGWPAFYQAVDLFGTDELLGNETKRHAEEALGEIEPFVIRNSGFGRGDLMPIAATTSDMDLFVMAKPTSVSPGVILWYAAQEIERYASFTDFFMAIIDYNRREFAAFLEQTKSKVPSSNYDDTGSG